MQNIYPTSLTPAQYAQQEYHNGLPRLLNHLAQRALEEAATQNSRTVTTAHMQRALELLPWVTRLAP